MKSWKVDACARFDGRCVYTENTIFFTYCELQYNLYVRDYTRMYKGEHFMMYTTKYD